MSILNHPTLLREAFLYFCKFPLQFGILSTMFRGSSSLDQYNDLLSEVTRIPDHSLVPEIESFLFSSNEDKLKKEIEDTKGVFMLLDYGELSSSEDNLKRKNDSFEMGIIIARKLDPATHNMAEILLLQDELLKIIRKVREQMIADSIGHPFVKQLEFPHRISPWYARELHHATGFSMMFSKTGVDMI